MLRYMALNYQFYILLIQGYNYNFLNGNRTFSPPPSHLFLEIHLITRDVSQVLGLYGLIVAIYLYTKTSS